MLSQTLLALAGAVAGGTAGWGGRLLLARLRRGVVLRPPVLEVSGAAITALGVTLAWPGPTVGFVVWAGLLAVILGAVDVAAHRLPDALTLPAIPITAALVLLTWWYAPESGRPVRGLVVAIVVTAVFWAVAALAPRAMGLGDVKLVPSLALMAGYLGVPAVLWWLMLAFVLGAAVSLVGLAAGRMSLRSAIPFGPCLLTGCWVVLALPGVSTI